MIVTALKVVAYGAVVLIAAFVVFLVIGSLAIRRHENEVLNGRDE